MEKEESGRAVRLGERGVTFPSHTLQQLHSCNHVLHDREALLKQLHEESYLFVRGLHDRNEVLTARDAVIRHIRSATSGQQATVPFMEGINEITHCQEVLSVLEGERPKAFFRRLFNEDCKTFDYKWLRGVLNGGFTGAHVDRVYMGRGKGQLLTMWTPLDDVTVEMGTLVVCHGSSSLPGFSRLHETYGEIDVEAINLQGTGWFTNDPSEITEKFGGIWKTSDFQAGDVMIFGMRTVHMSTCNLTNKIRISCDTRWLRQTDDCDPRYVAGQVGKSEAKFGLWHEETKQGENQRPTIEQLKWEWKL